MRRLELPMRRAAAALTLICWGCVGSRSAPETVQWTFEELLELPTAEEVARVEASWPVRKMTLDQTTLVGERELAIGRHSFWVRGYSFRLNGSKRCGMVLLPRGAAEKSVAGLLDIGDVSWDYPDRDITRGNALALRERLKPDLSQTVFIYPGAGHLLDGTTAFVTARSFLESHVGRAVTGT